MQIERYAGLSLEALSLPLAGTVGRQKPLPFSVWVKDQHFGKQASPPPFLPIYGAPLLQGFFFCFVLFLGLSTWGRRYPGPLQFLLSTALNLTIKKEDSAWSEE